MGVLQVKEYAHDAVREMVPGLLAASISSHVPAMIDEVTWSTNRKHANDNMCEVTKEIFLQYQQEVCCVSSWLLMKGPSVRVNSFTCLLVLCCCGTAVKKQQCAISGCCCCLMLS